MLNVCEEEGNLPIGYRMAKGADRFSRQGSALAQTFLADLCQLGIAGVDWDWALCHMDTDLRRSYGEEYLLRGITHPITHTLDLSFGYHCTAMVARAPRRRPAGRAVRGAGHPLGQRLRPRDRSAGRLDVLRGRQVELLVPDPARHAGPDRARRRRRRVPGLLDEFFGYGADPVKQVGERPGVEELAAGYALNRFEGLNNEPDMEVPWAYHYLGRPDRTAEVVHAAVNNQFGLGRGGLPGNDDSGGLSSWYVWASLGLFPVAGQSLYLINAPSFAHARLDLGGRGAGDRRRRVRRAGARRSPPVRPVGPVQRPAAGAVVAARPRSPCWRSARDHARPEAVDWGRDQPAALGVRARYGLPDVSSAEASGVTSPASRTRHNRRSGTRDVAGRMDGRAKHVASAAAGHRRARRSGDLWSLR